ncbi:hypothetical protein BH09MYX1_BH09MYX1_08440 [soil metagenome]
MSATFTIDTQLLCPHGGMLNATPASTKVTINGSVVVTTADTWVVQACPFINPTTNAPNPCTSVVWLGGDLQVTAGAATISNASLGLCVGSVAPGPASLVQTQSVVETR